MTNQNPKAVAAAATSYLTSSNSVTFCGPLGRITLNDDGGFEIDRIPTTGYKNQLMLEKLQETYRIHPAISGKALPEDILVSTFVAIDSPIGENWGERKVTKVTNWLGEERYINHGYNAGGTWVDAWVD